MHHFLFDKYSNCSIVTLFMNNELGKLLKQLRLKAGLTRFELALKAGITPEAICKIERSKNEVNITLNTLRGLSKALNVDPKIFINYQAA